MGTESARIARAIKPASVDAGTKLVLDGI